MRNHSLIGTRGGGGEHIPQINLENTGMTLVQKAVPYPLGGNSSISLTLSFCICKMTASRRCFEE